MWTLPEHVYYLMHFDPSPNIVEFYFLVVLLLRQLVLAKGINCLLVDYNDNAGMRREV